MDAQRLKENFARVAEHGDAVALFFYSDLFLRNPHLRDMFPIGMTGQRDKLLGALGHIVSNVDDLGELVPFLQGLGRDHRKFGIIAEHYPHVGASLVATLRHYSGASWTPELEADWIAAYDVVSHVMLEAADQDAMAAPAWWNGEVVAVERRRFDIALLRVRPDQPLPYQPGQSVAVELPQRLRQWRYLSMANAPRPDHTLDFHVRLVDGGAVSAVLVRSVQPGDRMRMGAPVGTLVLDESSQRDVLMVAGSTGLAPLKAILEQLSRRQDPPRTTLFFGARTRDALYDLPHLTELAARCPWLTVVPAVSDEPNGHGFAASFGSPFGGPAGVGGEGAPGGQGAQGAPGGQGAQGAPGWFGPSGPPASGDAASGHAAFGDTLGSAAAPSGGPRIEHGTLAEVVGRYGSWHGHDVYVCGPDAMVESTADRLLRDGVPRDRIRLESFAQR
ncbi:globin domain-containing protein [Actinomadura rupiterrae]|uniref:globin domain-containing protein n=1 Tax=Actinomadura rupiterrae TaxID=559627 RepID=UPI0020A54A18|nr:globin domain-containing protein [Actinomadura rupiterrae]MCP2339730.1 NAD(P)H-flavin reductase [Actinomadura rupiterrae]